MNRHLKSLGLAAALWAGAAGSAYADPNGNRPGLNDPPLPSLRDPLTVSVPDAGASALLLATAVVAVRGFRLLQQRQLK